MNDFIEKFLTGERMKLRPVTEEDYEQFYAIEGAVGNQLLMNDDIPFPPTKEDLLKFLNGVKEDQDANLFGIELTASGQFIGTIAVYGVNWKNSTCQIGVALGADFQGKGYGTEAMRLLVDFIFSYMHINKVKLQVFSYNEQAIASYKKCGFTHEGTLREELFRFGTFHDVHCMGLLRKDWQIG